jgi:hypothetical protein
MTGVAERQPVTDIKAQLGMSRPRLNVMSTELVMPSWRKTTVLASVVVTGVDTPPPLVELSVPFSVDASACSPVSAGPARVVFSNHPFAAACICTIGSSLVGVPTGVRATDAAITCNRRRDGELSTALSTNQRDPIRLALFSGREGCLVKVLRDGNALTLSVHDRSIPQ